MVNRNTLAMAISAALFLSACGGGGGGGDGSSAPPPVQAQTCQDSTARNFGGPLPCVPRYRGPQDNATVPTNVDRAQRRNLNGAGVRVGIVDSAPGALAELAATVEGRVQILGNYFGPNRDQTPPSDGHGDLVAAVLAGRETAAFGGGVAPGASLIWAIGCSGAPGSGIFCSYDQREVFAAFAREGVRLVNISIGGAPFDPNVVLSPQARALFQPILDGGMLVVYGAGNDGAAQPTLSAALPFYAPEFRNNWLAVAGAAIGANGVVTGLDPRSNACGVAADWCVVAPFTVGGSNGLLADGTSFSTPIVTGTAALVWQAFPWMSASNVQQTILTTAQDLGAPGVDPVFGWGMVDADRATRGPAQFLGTFLAVVPSGEYQFSNAIGGAGGITLRGNGLLELSASNTYTGLTSVEGGTLALSGTVAGAVRNSATFRSVGGRIGGDYIAVGDNATTEVQVGRGFTVTGTARLDGTLRLLAPAPSYVVPNRETVLTAGSIVGTFDRAVAGSGFFYSASLDYLAGSVVATLSRTSAKLAAEQAGAGEAVVTVGGWLDTLLGHLDGRLAAGEDASNGMFAQVARITSVQSAEQAVATMQSLAGEVQGTVRAAGIEQTLSDAAVIAERAEGLRYASDEGVAGWFQVTGRSGDLENGAFANADVREHGAIAGFDVAVGDRSRVGAALATSELDGDLDSLAGEFAADRSGVALYGRSEVGPLALTGVLGYDRTRIDTDRQIELPDAVEAVSARRTDRAWHARLEAGYDLPTWTPFFAVGAVEQRMGSYTEAGAGGLGLAASEDAHTLTYVEVGGRVRRSLDSGAFLSGYVAGRFLTSGEDVGYAARFAGAPAAGFITEGQSLPGTTVRVGANYLSRDFGGWRWFADLGVEQTSDGLRNGTAGLGVRVDF